MATDLLLEALRRAGAAGATRVCLWIKPDNHAAAALYGTHGFRRHGVVLVRHAGAATGP